MRNYTIDSKHTNYDAIVKFEANHFLVKNESFEFNNIDEAKVSPLAQELFYLPFVKTVYIAQNFIAIEKYDIIEWEDVENEVSEQIKNYLNSGKPVVKVAETAQKTPTTVYAETTPNPQAMKFATNRKLVLKTTEYTGKEQAKGSPLAMALFNFPFVKQVFFDTNFISITKNNTVEWPEIDMQLREFIRNYLEEGKTVITDESPSPNQYQENPSEKDQGDDDISLENLDPVSKEIVSILDDYVKPAVASDGGNIKFDSYDADRKRVKVILQGACSGCPSSTLTLKNGIENILKDMMKNKVETVEAING